MESWERELYVTRIVAGKSFITIDGTNLYIVCPTREQRFIAAEVYRNARRDAELDGALTDKELVTLLINQRIWTLKDGEELEKLIKALEELKVQLYENRLRSSAKLTIRTAIRKTKDEISRLESIRHGLDHVTIDGLALSAKYRYQVGATILYEDGTPYWRNGSWDREDPFIDNVMEILSHQRINETQFRELARNEPWRSIWGAKSQSGRGIFDAAAVDLSDEQRNLMLWSSIYDNIREYPDCPNEDIMSDDDMLDGWMTIQRRKREKQAASQEAESIGNAKIRNADEQFIFVDTIEDAREVDKMNDPTAAMTKAQRLSYLKRKGEVTEANMPDTAQKIAMQYNELEQIKMRQLRGK